MKQVWKCDHCSQTDLDPDKILKHEPKCSFNKATKHCHTCKFSREDRYDYSIRDCDINEDMFKGEKEGNCLGWVYEYLEEDRDDKLKELGL